MMFFTLISANICVTIIIIECFLQFIRACGFCGRQPTTVFGAWCITFKQNHTGLLLLYHRTAPATARAVASPPPRSKASNGSSNGLELRKESTSAVVLWCAMVWSTMHSTTGCCLAIIDLNVLALFFFLSFAPHLAIEITTYFALECVCMQLANFYCLAQ